MKPQPSTPSVIHHATCLLCGCLCDDLSLVVESGRLVEARRACDLARAHLLADRQPRQSWPEATILGQPSDLPSALSRASQVLASARAPLILGLSFASIEAQSLAVALADRLGASIDPARSASALPSLLAMQRAGRVSATLGEVRNRADLVVFWGCDPLSTHPRHLERYSAEPSGRFVPDGRSNRHLIVVDSSPSRTASVADTVLAIPDHAFLPALSVLRALLRNARLDPARVRSSCGVPLDSLRDLADRLRSARYGAFFFGERLPLAPGGSACVESAFLLVRDLNESTRFVALNLGAPGNLPGAESVLAWQSGSGRSTDFSRGFPRFLPSTASAEARLLSGSADAALIVADDPSAWLSPSALARLEQIPTVRIDPDATRPGLSATVALACAETGLEYHGTVMRSDGVCLPLRPALPDDRPSASELLESLLDLLDRDQGEQP